MNGLKFAPDLGTNPYKFGLIGSTDAHTGLATAAEAIFDAIERNQRFKMGVISIRAQVS